jgi:hypothetical protein
MAIKRHNKRSAEQLLQRLMDAVNKTSAAAKTQRALVALMESRFGDYRIADDVVATMRSDQSRLAENILPTVENMLFGAPEWPDTQVHVKVRSMRISLKETEAELDGPAEDLAALQMILLLRLVGPERRAQCTAALPFTKGDNEFDTCGKYYLRKGKRTYCSYTCWHRMDMRKKRGTTDPIE